MKHIVLDLDETIVNISVHPGKHDQFKFKIGVATYYGQKRPGLARFLDFLFATFESVNIWTAATREYADQVLLHIMTPVQRAGIKFLFTRNNLKVEKNGTYSKPLRKIFALQEAQLLGLNRTNTLMVDDRAEMFKSNKGNGLVIPPWHRNPNDRFLYQLIHVLNHMCTAEVGVRRAKEPMKLINICRE